MQRFVLENANFWLEGGGAGRGIASGQASPPYLNKCQPLEQPLEFRIN